MKNPKCVNKYKASDGWVGFYSHPSEACHTEMKFSIFLPPKAENKKVPVLYWLSGLTCTEENFMHKAGVLKYASKHGLMLVAPDTSPRGAGIEGEEEDWDFGTGAGFYLNATEPKWKKHYRMYDYVTQELPALMEAYFGALPGKKSIFGHSMGGHGALIIALKNPGQYKSVSAFAPICAPSLCPWGKKAFTRYLGNDEKGWAAYDANCLVVQAEERLPLLIDQGTDDNFLKEQLYPETFKRTCEAVDHPISLRMQTGYDHSYYFISSFIKDHIEHHAKALN